MANLINTAISGLKLSQLALSVAGQNIVNANTEGYSRQSITAVTTAAQRTTAGYLGTGVAAVDIFRNTQQFIIDQVNRDISVLSNFDSYLSNINQTDNLLANPNTSLATGMNRFFEALNEAVNDPASLLGRQLLLTQTQLLTQNFQTLETQLKSQNVAINAQFDTLAANVTTLANNIAQLNKAISDKAGITTSKLPNDLLDQRDQLLRDLAQLVDVTVVQQGDQSVDVFIAEGQGLVIGSTARALASIAGPMESDRRELAFVTGPNSRVVTKQISGGELGGLARFRTEALDPALSAVGRIALAVADGLNKQQGLGIDLEGNPGGAVFTDINDPALANNRVRADSANRLPNDRQLSVTIDDISLIKATDYVMNFEGPGTQYSIIRESDNKLIAEGVLGEKLPVQITIDGFTINLKAGSFQPGDRFKIMPTKTGVSDIKVLITRPEAFAFASPLRTQAGSGNSGGAFIVSGSVTDITTAAFTSTPGALSPPIMIRFTSPTTYDVLDYSDPANPIALKPPLNNQQFSPGIINNIFPSDPGGTSISTVGSIAGRINIGDARNGYQQEMLRFTRTDPVTGLSTEQRFLLPENQSAADIAQNLSNLAGVKASAFSQLQLSDFTTDNTGAPMSLMLNGVNLTDPTYIPPGFSVAQALPDPLHADFLRDRINASDTLRNMGISASSDGFALTVRSVTGVDLNVKVGGNVGDALTVRDGDLRSITGTKALNFGATFTSGSSFDIDLGFGVSTVALTPGTYAASELVEAVQKDVDAALGAGAVVVQMNAEGRMVLRSAGDARVVKVSNVSQSDPLGITPTRISGPDEGALPAQLSAGLNADKAYDFSVQNATFLVVIDGTYADSITLNQNYAADSSPVILAEIQAQIAASTGANGLAGRVTVDLDAQGALRFRSVSVGADAKVSIASGPAAQGLVRTGTVSGLNTGGSNASLIGNVSLSNGFDFNVGGPHRFNIRVDGSDPVMVELSGSSSVPARFSGTVDVSNGVDFSAIPSAFDLAVNGAAAVSINLSGVNTTLAATADQITPPGILTHVQARLDAALGAGVVTAGLDDDGFLTLATVTTGDSATLTVSNATGAVLASVLPLGGTVTGTETGAAGVADLIRTAINDALAAEGLDPINVGVSTGGFLSLASTTYGADSQLAISSVQGTYGALFPRSSVGAAYTRDFTVGGSIDVQLDANIKLTSNRNNGLFGREPAAQSNYTGYQVSINSGQGAGGSPMAGDTFLITYNKNGSADNRNGVAMAGLNQALSLSQGNLTYQGAYGQLVENLGILTNQARMSQEASETLLRQSMSSLQSVAGVNVDEEAARLIEFEQHYNASARLIALAKEMFDAILNL